MSHQTQAKKASAIMLPGFGKPLTARNDNTFPMAVLEDSHEGPLLTVREYTMMELMNRASDKPDWHRKVFDPVIGAKWKEEALAADGTNAGGDDLVDISPKMVDWCIEELKYKADVFRKFDCVETLDGIWKSDTVIPEALRTELMKAVFPLEDVPEKDKDWHPGSHGKVLDLVHPSIYPLVYGQSKILPSETCGVEDCLSWIGKGQTVPKIEDEGVGLEWSKKYQWLPTEFETPDGTKDVRITSYINNLHPERHRDLYSIISQIVDKAIPLWDRVLACVSAKETVPCRISDWDNSNCGFEVVEELVEEDGEDDDQYYDRLGAWRDAREVIQPEPVEFTTPYERYQKYCGREFDPPDLKPSVSLRKDFGRLQIIIKLANIHLTPEEPTYEGGTWHVEGQANESICATALYYYSSENISESLLAFRQQVDAGMDLNYEQNDFRAMETIYGFDNEDPSIQELGSVVTRQGRLLCFPNVMQHRVHPFQLSDPTKPGHRKILALFLVDPNNRIISTANVPPQQKAWWKESVEQSGALGHMPAEIQGGILDATDFPVSLAEAKVQREELMKERTEFVTKHNEDFENRNFFSLCEH